MFTTFRQFLQRIYFEAFASKTAAVVAAMCGTHYR
jgi:hypothetical protein